MLKERLLAGQNVAQESHRPIKKKTGYCDDVGTFSMLVFYYAATDRL
jgi:hypothetical protein